MTWLDKTYLGPAPADEPCAQVGDADYLPRAMRECRAYMTAIRRVIGEEPDGARLRIERSRHDFGEYLEVVCEFDPSILGAEDYAVHCEMHAPTYWHQARMTAPTEPETCGKRYIGERTPDGVMVAVVNPDGTTYQLDPRYDLRNHSPTGFEIGYSGSGPSQLALALLADALGDDEKAQDNYQAFKFKIVSRLDGDRFELTEEKIRRTVDELARGRGI